MDYLQNFIQLFKNEIAQVLQHIMNDIINNRELPKSWNDASISLLPKKIKI